MISERSDMIPEHCLACGFPITLENFSPVNSLFHRVCMNDGVYVDLDRAKYTEVQLKDTWAERLKL